MESTSTQMTFSRCSSRAWLVVQAWLEVSQAVSSILSLSFFVSLFLIFLSTFLATFHFNGRTAQFGGGNPFGMPRQQPAGGAGAGAGAGNNQTRFNIMSYLPIILMLLFYVSNFFGSSTSSTPFSFHKSSYYPFKHNIETFNSDYSHVEYYVPASTQRVLAKDKTAKLKFEFDVLMEYQNVLYAQCQDSRRKNFFSVPKGDSLACEKFEELFGVRR